jgi:hypothetical protein
MTATVPAEYGRLNLATAHQGIYYNWKEIEIEELVWIHNKWKVVCDGDLDRWSFELEFENSTGNGGFVVRAVGQEDRTLWCSVQTSRLDPHMELKRWMDRSSIILDDGWVVTVALGASPQGPSFAEMDIEITRSAPTLQSVPMPKPPTRGCIALLVTPPAPHHGYTLAENNLAPFKGWGTPLRCVPHQGSFIVYTKHEINGNKVVVGPFKSSSGRPYFLFLLGSEYLRTVWDPMTMISQVGWGGGGGHPLGTSYSVTLDEGKKVYVHTWKSRDTSLANYCIKLSM